MGVCGSRAGTCVLPCTRATDIGKESSSAKRLLPRTVDSAALATSVASGSCCVPVCTASGSPAATLRDCQATTRALQRSDGATGREQEEGRGWPLGPESWGRAEGQDGGDGSLGVVNC